jgi:KDO2-lipid IV(A) lauroyltransferase
MYYILYALLYLVSLLPFFILYRISDLIFFILYYVIGYRKHVVLQNLDIAFPDKSKEEKRKIAIKFYINLADSVVEMIKLLSISKHAFLKRAGVNIEHILPLVEKGKNIQFHCGHQFGWEYGNWIVAMNMPIPFIGIYMKLSNGIFNRIVYQLRSRSGTILVSTKEFKQKMHQLFSSQYSIGLAADQKPLEGSKAYWLNFFGTPTPFVVGPDKAAIKNNTAVVFVNLKKIKRGHYFFETEVYCENGSQCKEGEITVSYRDFLEKSIKEQPDNYLWSHRRWKYEYTDEYSSRWIDTTRPSTKNG